MKSLIEPAGQLHFVLADGPGFEWIGLRPLNNSILSTFFVEFELLLVGWLLGNIVVDLFGYCGIRGWRLFVKLGHLGFRDVFGRLLGVGAGSALGLVATLGGWGPPHVRQLVLLLRTL